MLAAVAFTANADVKITSNDINIKRLDDKTVDVSMKLVIDSLNIKKNQQLFITPTLTQEGTDNMKVLPSVLVNGRNMHYLYLRDKRFARNYNVNTEVYYKNDKQTVGYFETIDLEDWMFDNNVVLALAIDTCGCGKLDGNSVTKVPVTAPAPAMPAYTDMLLMPFPRPIAGNDKIIKHEGRARIQFEVDRTELHVEPYKCKRDGKVIDNRQQLQMIDDSLRYALSTPNLELVGMEICGYASPESPYDHNDYLATNRARVVMEYIEKRHNLPEALCRYSAVPENWKEFREQVVSSDKITEQQRQDLLELIDRPIISTTDYDRKEKELRTSPRFAKLYKTLIHKEWFPYLRATNFTISTHLKPMSVEQLREVMKTQPELMSLNHFYLVANSYEHGSQEFLEAMQTALKYYPNDPIANANAAGVAIEAGDLDLAETYLQKAGDSDEANIMRGIIAVKNKDLDAARALFKKASTQPEAVRNLKLIEQK